MCVLTDNDRVCLLCANPVVNQRFRRENETKNMVGTSDDGGQHNAFIESIKIKEPKEEN